MRIEGWQIEGFGIFRDWEVRGLSSGLTVFLGPNEAGKSTLLGFLRAALFGFPGRRSRSPQYPPLLGGRHGGRLYLCGPEGEVTVERVAAGRKNELRVNGRESTGEDLQALLGGADENVFCSVFAFSLSEMQSFEWLKAEQVRERIFSAGIAGAGASARRVIETLDAEAAAMFRPRGGSRVRELSEQIEQAERRLKAAQADAGRYSSLVLEQEKWNARATALAAEEQDLRRRQRSVETLLELWSDRERAREQFATLDPIDEFPSDPEARLATLSGHLAAARAIRGRLDQEQSARERMRDQLAAGWSTGWPNFPIASRNSMATSLTQGAADPVGRRALEKVGRPNAAYARQVGLILGACLAFPAGWLTKTGQVAGDWRCCSRGSSPPDSWCIGEFTSQERWAAKVVRLEQEVAGWEQPVREWCISAASAETAHPGFLDLRVRCQQDAAVRFENSCLSTKPIPKRGVQLESARSEESSAEQALQRIFREGAAADEAEFQSRLRMFRSRQQLAALIQDRETRIGAAEMTLAAGRVDEWRSESSRLEEGWGRSRRSATRRWASSVCARRRGGRWPSPSVPTIKAELEWLQTELAAALRDWRVSTIARELVSRTLQDFTRTRQPVVLEEASRAFARITSGVYERILQDQDGESLVIVDCNAQRKRPEELSRGTVEQLYLCLRLGLAGEFARAYRSAAVDHG
jgi:uncharacterized protein YhaN